MIDSIKLLGKERKLILTAIEGLSEDQLLQIPEGFNNNVLWNLGHLVVTQQALHYMLTRNEMYISKDMMKMYRTGTNPNGWAQNPDIDEIKSLLISLPDKLLEDYQKNIFAQFRSYKTSVGFEVTNFEEAIAFNHYHEGTHTGIILNLIKLLG